MGLNGPSAALRRERYLLNEKAGIPKVTSEGLVSV